MSSAGSPIVTRQSADTGEASVLPTAAAAFPSPVASVLNL